MRITKASLVVVGTVTGLGAVLAYSPPHKSLQLGGGLKGLTGGTPATTPAATPAAPSTPAPTPSQSSTPTPTPTPAATQAKPAPAPKATKAKAKYVAPKKTAPPQPALINGTFNGGVAQTAYGPVQVQIDVKNSKIVGARALQLPMNTPRDQEINTQAVPILVSETVAASSSDIQGVSGASYTSQGWYDSLVSAISNAGL